MCAKKFAIAASYANRIFEYHEFATDPLNEKGCATAASISWILTATSFARERVRRRMKMTLKI
jgi:hypothetical protein